MKLDERIKELRLARGLSQVDLADSLGVTKQSVSNWENSNIQPSIDMLMRLANYFSVSTDYLLGMDDRDYIEATGLDDKELAHIRQIIDYIRKKQN